MVNLSFAAAVLAWGLLVGGALLALLLSAVVASAVGQAMRGEPGHGAGEEGGLPHDYRLNTTNRTGLPSN